MKKLLLLAAAAVAFGASAQTLTRTWKVETANALPKGECRQGVVFRITSETPSS